MLVFTFGLDLKFKVSPDGGSLKMSKWCLCLNDLDLEMRTSYMRT